MTRLDTHLLTRFLKWFALLLISATALLFLSQLFKILPALLDMPISKSGLLIYMIAPMLVEIVPFAFSTAILIVAFQMHRDGELTALDASGISRHRLMRTPLCAAGTCFVLLLVAYLILLPASVKRISRALQTVESQSVMALIQPEQFTPLSDHTQIYVQRKTAGELREVFLASGLDQRLYVVAKRAQISAIRNSDAASFVLNDGTVLRLRSTTSIGTPVAIQFDKFRIEVPLHHAYARLQDALPAHKGRSTSGLLASVTADHKRSRPHNLPAQFELYQRVGKPLLFLVLAILGIVLAFAHGSQSPSLNASLFAGAYLSTHFVSRACETSFYAQSLPIGAAILLPALAPLLVIGVRTWYFHHR